MHLKANFIVHASGTNSSENLHFYRISLFSGFLNLYATDAHTFYFPAWIRNHFSVKLSPINCNETKKKKKLKTFILFIPFFVLFLWGTFFWEFAYLLFQGVLSDALFHCINTIPTEQKTTGSKRSSLCCSDVCLAVVTDLLVEITIKLSHIPRADHNVFIYYC